MPLDEKGHEVPDPTPLRLPVGFKRPESLAEQVQRLVRRYSDEEAERQGFETLEEADDFDVDDEVDPHTPYETFFDPVLGQELTLAEFRLREAHYKEKYLVEQAKAFEQADRLEELRTGEPRPRRQASGRRASDARTSAKAEGGAPEKGEPGDTGAA